jgi:dolichol-phosphate mannosyltransferase
MTAVTHDQHLLTLENVVLGVVCPMANEAATVVQFVNEVMDHCHSHNFQAVHIFAVVDRVSTDNTLELLTEIAQLRPGLNVVWAPENRNVVDAYVRGYHEALATGCDWILEIDAGYSHQPREIGQFVLKMREGYECVFGSRFCSGGQMIDVPFKRRLISRGGSLVTNTLLGTSLSDMTSGFEMFSKPALTAVLERGIRSQGPFFQTEIKAYCRKFSWSEVPITYRSPSHNINSWSLKDAFQNLWRLFQLTRAGHL